MNNKSSFIPRFLYKSKEVSGAERLVTKISGCIITSGWYVEKRKCLFYINHDQVLLILFENLSSPIIILSMKTDPT